MLRLSLSGLTSRSILSILSVSSPRWFGIILAAGALSFFVLAIVLRAVYVFCFRTAASGTASRGNPSRSMEEREIERALLEGRQPVSTVQYSPVGSVD